MNTIFKPAWMLQAATLLMATAAPLSAQEAPLAATRIFGGRYAPGETLSVKVVVECPTYEPVTGFYLSETIPDGWTLAQVAYAGQEASLGPAVGATNRLEFLWANVPAFPYTLEYHVQVPGDAVENQAWTNGFIKWTHMENTAFDAMIGGGLVVGSSAAHSADSDKDGMVSFDELERVIELYEAGEYHADGATPDGFAPGAGVQEGLKHDSDFAPGDWSIAMRKELFRAVQLYNAGAYHRDPATSDAFAPTAFLQYMVIDISGGTAAFRHPVSYTDDVPAGGWDTDEYKTDKLVLRRIPKGTFTMGSPSGEDEGGAVNNNETQHSVTLTQDYYMALFPVTQRQWELVMGGRPSFFTNETAYATRPVEQVAYNQIHGGNWPDSGTANAASFIGRIRARAQLPAFNLPTEAQWERACRAETTTAFNNGTAAIPAAARYGENSSPDQADGASDSSEGTAPVGTSANNWGLYDMHGNVAELCLDIYNGGALPDATDPPGAASGAGRILRGGAWSSASSYCRSAYRSQYAADDSTGNQCGFRPVCVLPANAK